MAVTDWKLTGTAVNETGVGTQAWNNTSNATQDDDNWANTNSAANFTSNFLKATNFGFTTSDIPDGSTIDGLEVRVRWSTSSTFGGNSFRNRISAVKGGTISSTNGITEASLTTTLTNYDHGASDYLWGETWSDSDIRSSGFGFACVHRNSSSFSNHGRIARVWARVHYTEGGGPSVETRTASLSAALQATRSLSGSLSAALQRQDVALTASLSGALASTGTAAASLDAALRAAHTRAASLSAALQGTGARTADLDAALSITGAVTTSLDAVLQASATRQAELDAALRATGARSASLDAALSAGGLADVDLDAALQAWRTATASLSAVLTGGSTTLAIAPDTILATTNLKDTLDNIPPTRIEDITQDPNDPIDGKWSAVDPTLATLAHLRFPPPPGEGALVGEQLFELLLPKTAGTPHPTAAIRLLEDGVLVATLESAVSITSVDGTYVAAPWDAALITDKSKVEIEIVGTPGEA